MFPRLALVAPGFSQDQWSEINERLENVEEHYRQLAVYHLFLRCRIKRLEKRNRFVSSWVAAIADSHAKNTESLITLEEQISAQQHVIDELTLRLLKLTIN